MTYDIKSFMAGLRTGLILPRPPQGSYIDTGLGWRARTEYVLANARLLGVYDTGESPSYVYVDNYDVSHPAWSVTGHRVDFALSNVESPVYWMYTRTTHPTNGYPAYAIIAVSQNPFSMTMTGYSTTEASKPPVYAPNYVTSHSGFDTWGDCYGIVMGWWYSNPYYGADWWEQVGWTAETSRALHKAVLGIIEVAKPNDGASVNAFVRFPVSGTYKYVGVGLSTVSANAEVDVDETAVSYTTRARDGLTFTMYYTDQIDTSKNVVPYVPVITVSNVPDISNLEDYQTAIFNAVWTAAGVSVVQGGNS